MLGLPIAVDLLFYKGQWRLFFTWSIISAVLILTPQIAVDSYYYGKPVLASLNIVLYNVFTSHGPDLYGTEPASFYLVNGCLNFNFIFLLALAVLPALAVTNYILKKEVSSHGYFLSETLSQAPMYLWFLVFWSQVCMGGGHLALHLSTIRSYL